MLLLGLAPCLVVAVRGRPFDGLVALELANGIATLALLLLAEGFKRSVYFNLALALTVMSFVGGLVLVRFLERLER